MSTTTSQPGRKKKSSRNSFFTQSCIFSCLPRLLTDSSLIPPFSICSLFTLLINLSFTLLVSSLVPQAWALMCCWWQCQGGGCYGSSECTSMCFHLFLMPRETSLVYFHVWKSQSLKEKRHKKRDKTPLCIWVNTAVLIFIPCLPQSLRDICVCSVPFYRVWSQLWHKWAQSATGLESLGSLEV